MTAALSSAFLSATSAPRSTSSSWFHSRLFQSRFRLPSCKSAKIMTDARTSQSRGYGFVRFLRRVRPAAGSGRDTRQRPGRGKQGHDNFWLEGLGRWPLTRCRVSAGLEQAKKHSGRSRGSGFVRFSDESDQQRALVEVQGVSCGSSLGLVHRP